MAFAKTYLNESEVPFKFSRLPLMNTLIMRYTYDFDLRATHARTLLPAALASVSFGFVLVRVRVFRVKACDNRPSSVELPCSELILIPYAYAVYIYILHTYCTYRL